MPNIIDIDLGQVLGGKPSGVTIKGWDAPTPALTPKFDTNYVYPSWVQDIIIWLRTSENLWISGPTGCGKTSALKNVMALFNYPVYEVTGHSHLEFTEMVGSPTILKDGSIEYKYGPLSLAMKHGGLFLLNEVDLLPPDTLAGLNSVLDGSPLCIPENGGEVIEPCPMFRFAATANSSGSGDDTGMYQGVLRMNMAAMDRFMIVPADYIPEEQELALLERRYPTVPEQIRRQIIAFASAVRTLFSGGEAEGMDTAVEMTFSTRTCLRVAHLFTLYEPLRKQGVNPLWYSMQRAAIEKASPGTKATFKELFQRITGTDVQ